MTSHNPTCLRQAFKWATSVRKPTASRPRRAGPLAHRHQPGKPSLTPAGASKTATLNDPQPLADIRFCRIECGSVMCEFVAVQAAEEVGSEERKANWTNRL